MDKIKREFNIPYLPLKDFDPEKVYKELRMFPGTYNNEQIDKLFLSNYKNAHTIVTNIDYPDGYKFVVDPYLLYGESAWINNLIPDSKYEASLDVDLKDNNNFLAVVTISNNKAHDPHMVTDNDILFPDRESAETYLYGSYISYINNFIDRTLDDMNRAEVGDVTREDILRLDMGFGDDWINWDNKEIFIQKLRSPDPKDTPTLYIQENYPSKELTVRNYQVVKVFLP